ncbi:2OG-Fe dioxygenase-domain-containing protein [Aspergillus karnatakaensis]|uniref:2OG-Fe dioxygenase-domain-containing protein n=1 Tax=Aspergillus karnatakaensis TaxID=1810916 RepID=UPI003CCD83ED
MAEMVVQETTGPTSPALSTKHFDDGILPASNADVCLDIWQQAQKPEFFQSVATAMQLRQSYLRDGCIFIEGKTLIPILKGIGAKDEDFEKLKEVSHHLDPDPTVNYRTLRSGRFSVDTRAATIERLERQPFILTTAENYKRHDSDIPRDFGDFDENHQNNTVVQAMLIFKTWVTQNVPVLARPGLDYHADTVLTEIFNVHTFTNQDIQGYPALEGVHQDGSDHTMTVMLGFSNITLDSGITLVHARDETTGIQPLETNMELLKGRYQHRDFLDTLLFTDNSFKHSVTPVYARDKSQPSYRDMFVIFSRKPRSKVHSSGQADSLEPHERFKLKFPIWLPPQQGGGTYDNPLLRKKTPPVQKYTLSLFLSPDSEILSSLDGKTGTHIPILIGS